MKKSIGMSLVALSLAASAANAGAGLKIGLLTCDIDGGIGYVIGSSKAVDCVYQSAGGGKIEHYEGSIGKLGVDIGITGQSIVAWAVFAPGKVKPGALQGNYEGVSAEATVIGGVGANVLVGGFDNAINLQPVSIQAQTGLNVAAGVAGLRLDYVE